MTKYFSSLVEQSLSRSTEATLSILGITQPNLREHLAQQMASDCGSEGSFLATPMFEQTFGWAESKVTMRELAEKDSLLSKKIVESLDAAQNGRYRFGANWKPFTHQLASWRSLLEKKNSVVVTSGTGSGKTECFMVPVLEDLYREYRNKGAKPLVGVRALFLYPLNALINSQRERLDAWTQAFGEGIRYCLYNGNTKELSTTVRTAQSNKKNEVLSRQRMREVPAPILVTNGTMLEYMMVRQVDAPIVQISREQKSLRWIVLDEAHTYVGSQAAELALQLRRVMNAFGVTPQDVRFVATSATIAGDDSAEQLKTFLSDLSGVPKEQIDVLGGNRVIPPLSACNNSAISLDALDAMSEVNPTDEHMESDIHLRRYHALTHSPEARIIRDMLVSSPKPLKLTDITERLRQSNGMPLSQKDVLRWIDICSGTRPDANSPAFLKVRAHFFQRNTQGFWSCVDKNCTAKRNTPIDTNWPFGYVYVNQRQTCQCGSPVFELSFCNDCNEPHLLACDKQGKLVQWDAKGGDEFSLQDEFVEDIDEKDQPKNDDSTAKIPFVISASLNNVVGYSVQQLDKKTRQIGVTTPDSIPLNLNDSEPACGALGCGNSSYHGASPFRRALLGGPFYVANIVPTVLEYCPDFKSEDDNKNVGPQSLPGRGRRLITFTDSRQGTARMAVRMQQEAERSCLRGSVIEALSWHQKKQQGSDNPNAQVSIEQLANLAEQAKQDAKNYREWGMPLEAKAEEEKCHRLEQQVNKMRGQAFAVDLSSLTWSEMVNELKQKTDLKGSMLLYNKYHKPEIFSEHDGPVKLAEMLLFREFMRRPKRTNSLETQGLVKIGYVGLDKIHATPVYWKERGLSLNDWTDFLKVALDFYVRENSFVQLEDDWKQWIGSRFSSKTLRNPNSQENDESRVKRWPQIRNGNHTQRLIKLLLLGANLDYRKPDEADLVNAWLQDAWLHLTDKAFVLKNDGNQFYLPREHLTFSLVSTAFICPVTNKLLDTTFKGLTPYLPTHINFAQLTDEQRHSFQAKMVDMPDIWRFVRAQDDYSQGIDKLREQIAQDTKIQNLRSQNLWTDINDRAVEGGFYYRTAEHSAQQSAERLENYEDMFKKGQVNVLNCSTTMEMGVDIGGISAVVMNNVPPHPANYLQRAGRAGRSKESRALAYTLCKGNPHDQQVFANPAWPFETIIPAPAVAMNSARLVQRHINSLLLSDFLCNQIGETQKERTNLNTQWFFDDNGVSSICDNFIDWLKSAVLGSDQALMLLVKGTVLQGIPAGQLRGKTVSAINALKTRWVDTYHYLVKEEKQAKPDTPYLKRLELERIRHCGEYLLRDLAARTFLPGYGFPTDVVNFDNFTIEDFIREKSNKGKDKKDREDNVSRYKGLPSRNLSVAIREYAPGAEIILDGRVFRSAGVSLHWHNLSADSNEPQRIDMAWRCHHCGELGYQEGVGQETIICTNAACEKSITDKNIRKVLQPAGFVTDAYRQVTNNIEAMRFIPVVPSWVFVEAERIKLPNPVLGHMTYGVNGHVFHQSLGETGHGYALCMTCGRAESMLSAKEAPKSMLEHYPPRPSREDRDEHNKRMVCQGSGSILPNITLGALSRTDVFELVLRRPISGEYILDNTEQGISVATTLAVALRRSLAGILGVSAAELGYSTRPVRLDNNQSVLAIQLYDVISGGAGFASSAPLHIEALLKGMVSHLGCVHCDTACSECLLDSQTRHDHDILDHTRALDWLGHGFTNYIGLSQADKLSLQDAVYCPGSIEDSLRRLINSGAKKVILWIDGTPGDWDLFAPPFRKMIHNYLLRDEVEVGLVIPPGTLGVDIQRDLYQFAAVGAKIYHSKNTMAVPVVAQAINNKVVTSLASKPSRASIPGHRWHQNEELVVRTDSLPMAMLSEIDVKSWVSEKSIQVVDVAICEQLNGPIAEFGHHFWSFIAAANNEINNVMLSGKISRVSYTDRYIQNPVAVVLLGALLSHIRPLLASTAEISIKTLFKAHDRSSFKPFHDWAHADDHSAFSQKWLSQRLGTDVTFAIYNNNREIPHHRKLLIEFDNGKSLKIRFDQGMGYWKIDFLYLYRNYDFSKSVDEQVEFIDQACLGARVKNLEARWSTDVLVEISDPE